MSAHIAGFICALILAALVIVWIAYCMFFRERHKPEHHQFNISDLRHRNYKIAQEQEEMNKTKITAGVFILPSRHKQKYDDYEKRPDYPESPIPVLPPSPDKLANIFKDSSPVNADVHFNDGLLEIDSCAPYHSDV